MLLRYFICSRCFSVTKQTNTENVLSDHMLICLKSNCLVLGTHVTPFVKKLNTNNVAFKRRLMLPWHPKCCYFYLFITIKYSPEMFRKLSNQSRNCLTITLGLLITNNCKSLRLRLIRFTSKHSLKRPL